MTASYENDALGISRQCFWVYNGRNALLKRNSFHCWKKGRSSLQVRCLPSDLVNFSWKGWVTKGDFIGTGHGALDKAAVYWAEFALIEERMRDESMTILDMLHRFL